MQFTRRADYAARTMLDVAGLEPGSVALTHEVAARQGIPGPFLAKIVLALVRSGLLRSHRGSGGGIALARPSDQITLLQVVEAVDGPMAVNSCVLWPGECTQVDDCPIREIWCETRLMLVERLRRTRLSDLVVRGRALRGRRVAGEASDGGCSP